LVYFFLTEFFGGWGIFEELVKLLLYEWVQGDAEWFE
jgi:hypothetical protein